MIFETIHCREAIDKGWSGDRKYCVTDAAGKRYLLRISEAAQYDRRKAQFARMELAAAKNIPMCLPVEFGTCDEGVYSLHSWIDGVDAESEITAFPEKVQYRYGMDAGRILKKLHRIPAPPHAEPWETRFNKKIDRKMAMYQNCPLRYEGGDAFLRYIDQNRCLLRERPQSYQHGDYHIGNMMIDRSGKLVIIDFEKDDWGDPWEEFNRIVWCVQASPAFASGLVDGYFDGSVPVEFWRLLALYICANTVSSLPWAIPFGEQEIAVMTAQAAQVLEWYDRMERVVPSWYRKLEEAYDTDKV